MSADQINKILHEVIVSDSGISRVILADKTGLTIAHTSRFAFDEDVDIDGLGAVASAVYLATEQQGTSVSLEDLRIMISEFDKGKILIASCGKTVLCLITEAEIQIGLVRQVMKDAAEQIMTFYGTQMKVPQTHANTPDEEDYAFAQMTETVDDRDEAILSELEVALKELEHF